MKGTKPVSTGGETGSENVAPPSVIAVTSVPRQADHVAHVDGALVVVVRTSAGRYRRRVFLTLASAERSAERAREAGHEASVVLARLVPVEVAR